MKREIKFRGQRIDNGEWVYGYLVKDPNEKFRIYWQPFIEATNNTYHFVKPETVGQYIGLQDKEDKDVYERDIINIKSGVEYMGMREINRDCIVKFSFGSFNLVDKQHCHFDFGNVDEIEIIGNADDNPDMFEYAS